MRNEVKYLVIRGRVSPPAQHKNVNKSKPKIIVILGQTATGKSELAVKLAKQFGGEIISADSRQVYKGLDIGSGKITKKEMRGVSHHLLDVANPKRKFSVAQYKKLADKKIAEIHKPQKVPIIVGGTGFYIQAIVDNLILPAVMPNYTLRKKLEKKSTYELFAMLKKLDPNRADEIEKDNPRRLIRAIEIARELGKVPKLKTLPKYDALQIGLKLTDEKLKKKIHTRLIARMRKGMVSEVERLHSKGLSWKRLEALGLEYRYLALYLQKKLGKQEMLSKLGIEIRRFAKRQMRWFKRDKRIRWFKPNETRKIEKEIKKFLK
ncbi:MAG: tRNA (adenosine(37)-N6)-dimethylallyltransferase MiaA [Candidatus Pacebacteria bacterium]|jgi:tRNA dimethylallyltransferase|nr:tRNA (adenosine(37)-N6)-dimethylallyltransferase MiaA [Parcubacteria group bacterium]MDP6249264.1 tRNA (adenosine(37)-N6)-dimethylallyltransferase MiaA [Candidatus Paceibacterota bacterium]MDP7159072.1 tRNA (adenosine(37)-N6)-dimethylallyltransferase MiaA [Candidatus Paceibacterota bacterium]MDP7367358.1 tRNA (adenosine(37)-N6)-dimethylallyltransferase MiaA [Candidatus Paceibacterota bacterium]MDP7466122.1 tRNA (adenosine(37)-N6)-dimethylallyltransferase MiaA [Candidatus Paceibacterota bacte|tara:strand:+ start:41231 stop:42193 length:963 start_codon:yes stop_codon:yes gene_type:complete